MNKPVPIRPGLRPVRSSSCVEPLEARVAPATFSFGQNLASGYNTSVPVAHDALGNIFMAGVFDGQIDIDPSAATLMLQTQESNVSGPLGSDIYVAKFSADGTLLWAQSWGGVPGSGGMARQEAVRDILVDPMGNLFVLAEFDTVAAGIGGVGTVATTMEGTNDVALLKFNGGNGNLVTSFGNAGLVKFGGSGEDRAGRLGFEGSTGSLFVTGGFNSPDAQINGGGAMVAAVGNDETFVLKISALDGAPNGQFGGGGLIKFGSPSSDMGGRPMAFAGQLFLEAYEGKAGHVRKLDAMFGNPVAGFGSGGRIDIVNLGGVALDNAGRILATGGIAAVGGYLKRFDPSSGNIDPTFETDGTVDFGTTSQFGQSIVVDSNDNIYVAGTRKADEASIGQYFVARVTNAGAFDPSFGTNGRFFFGVSGLDMHREIRASVDNDGFLVMRGFFSGTTDLDPTNGTFSATAATPGPNVFHQNLDVFAIRIDPSGVDASNPFSLTDSSGDVVRISVAGTGSLRITPGTTPGVDIEKIETLNTDATTKLKIGLSKASLGTTTIASIVTPGANQDLGFLTLGKNVILGDGVPGGDPALKITGKAGKVALTDVNAHSTIDFGEGLAYLDTYTNQPNVTIRNILGDGVTIDVTGDGTAGGVGGGGLGKITVNNWMGAGLIKTTQSIKGFKQKFGDCYVVFEVDKFELGVLTKADIGSMSIPNGAWGSSGSEIEGNCGSFNCAAFLAGATLSAGSINTLTVKSGPYAGTVTMKDPSAAGMGTFKVNSDFVGYVDSASSIKNIKVAGDFMGSLLAKSIGSITAFTFDGTTTGDLFNDPLRHQIIATAGSLGAIKTTGGGMKNFEVAVFTKFGGFKISTGTGATVSTTGLDNVTVLAAEIGNISVAMKPHVTAGPITLIGMKDTIIESETSIGTVNTTHSVQDTLIAAATQMGNITVGSTVFTTQGVSTSMFLAGVNLGGDGAIDGDETFIRAGKIGNIIVKGAFLTSTIASGVNPVDGIFGNGNDIAGSGPGLPATQKAIGHIQLGAGSGTATTVPSLTHNYVIEGQKIASLKINAVTIPLTSLPKYLKVGGAEDVNDVLVRLV
jgi:hypothetical protein